MRPSEGNSLRFCQFVPLIVLVFDPFVFDGFIVFNGCYFDPCHVLAVSSFGFALFPRSSLAGASADAQLIVRFRFLSVLSFYVSYIMTVSSVDDFIY